MVFFAKLTDRFDRFSRLCATVSDTMLWVCLSGMAITVFTQVLARYVFHSSIHWSEELARYLMIWMGLIGASSVMRSDSHVSITLFMERLPLPVFFLLRVLSRMVIGIFLFMLIRHGISLAIFFVQQKSPALRISMFVPYSALYLSGILLGIHLINLIIKDIYGWITHGVNNH